MSDDRTPPELRRQIGRATTLHVDLEAGVYVYESSGMTVLCVREGTSWYRVWSGFRSEDMIVLAVLCRRMGSELQATA